MFGHCWGPASWLLAPSSALRCFWKPACEVGARWRNLSIATPHCTLPFLSTGPLLPDLPTGFSTRSLCRWYGRGRAQGSDACKNQDRLLGLSAPQGSFHKLGGSFCWFPYDKSPVILVSRLGLLTLGNFHFGPQQKSRPNGPPRNEQAVHELTGTFYGLLRSHSQNLMLPANLLNQTVIQGEALRNHGSW